MTIVFEYESWEREQSPLPTVSHGPGKLLCSVEFHLIYYFTIVFILGIYYVGNYFLSWKAKTLNCLNNKNLQGSFGGDHFPQKEEHNELLSFLTRDFQYEMCHTEF